MGRYYRGDIAGKLGFCTQPSYTFEQFGGILIEPTYIEFEFTGFMSDYNPCGFDKKRLLELVDNYNTNIENWKKKYKYCKPESLSKKEQYLMKLIPIEDIDKIIKDDNWEESFDVDIIDPYTNYIFTCKNSVTDNDDIRLVEDIYLGLKIYKQVLNNHNCYIEVDL